MASGHLLSAGIRLDVDCHQTATSFLPPGGLDNFLRREKTTFSLGCHISHREPFHLNLDISVVDSNPQTYIKKKSAITFRKSKPGRINCPSRGNHTSTPTPPHRITMSVDDLVTRTNVNILRFPVITPRPIHPVRC